MNRKTAVTILIILIIGIFYRLLLTANGNFFFNMDNGRDMVDVREMIVLHKLRLVGPTSAIEGFYNGPAWYYLLSIPFVLSGGNPYTAIIMEIILWAVGGFFLLKLVSKWGYWLIIPIGSVWIASDYIVLANRYAFNPNPVTLLAPLFIYLLIKYLEYGQIRYSISVFLLAGSFFNFEMNAAVFIPPVIVVSLILGGKSKFLKGKSFWIGIGIFILTLLPQIIFDLKHQFIMSQSVINFLLAGNNQTLNPLTKLQMISSDFYQAFLPQLMHIQILVWVITGFFIWKWKQIRKKDTVVIICLSLILVPFLGYLLLPVKVNLWHLGLETIAFLILAGFTIKDKIVGLFLGFVITLFSVLNVLNVLATEVNKQSSDPSIFRNETAAVDYVYKYANGKNFKVYNYLPSVYDYPYQYLFWWYGKKMYGYIPGEYAYSPSKPAYISNKEKFEGLKNNFSGLVFLIKEPDRINLRQAWENDFKNMQFISKEMVGPLEVEIRKQL